MTGQARQPWTQHHRERDRIVSNGSQAQPEAQSLGAETGRRRFGAEAIAAVVVSVATIAQAPAVPVYDATTYWAGSVGLVHGRDVYIDGLMSLRGVLTSVLYVPAALATRVLGEANGGMAVLVENGLLIALVGAVLLPRMLRVWGPVTPWMVLLSAGLTWLLVARLAPYPLTDLWGAVLIVAAIVLLQRRTAVGLASAGLVAGIALNIRPAYLAAALLALVVILLRERLAGLWFAAGAAFALLPQSIVNLAHGAGWKPWPPGTATLLQLQSASASYIVRYDTAAYGLPRDPQQSFCSATMAQIVGDHPPASTGELAGTFLQHLPQSLIFVAEKVAAALHWPISAPYYAPSGVGDQLFAFEVTAVTVLGTASLLYMLFKHGLRSATLAGSVAPVVWL